MFLFYRDIYSTEFPKLLIVIYIRHDFHDFKNSENNFVLNTHI